MHRHLSRTSLLVVVTLALLSWTTAFTATSVGAAMPGVDLVLDASKQFGRNPDGTFPSGATVTYTAAVSCNDDGLGPTCEGFELRAPRPTFVDVDGVPAAMTFVSASAGATALNVVAAPEPVITFVTPLTAGQTINVDLRYTIPAWVTPDQTVFTQQVTWGPAGSEATSPTVEVTARARAAWTTDKSGPTQVNVNTDATWTLQVCVVAPSTTGFGPLRARLAAAQLTDVLPAVPAGLAVEFRSATGGGTYDPETGTVTWALGDLSLTGSCRAEQVTLRFVAAQPLAASVPVTNRAVSAGTPQDVAGQLLAVGSYDLDPDDDHVITVKNADPGNPTLTKTATRTVIDLDLADGENDSEFAWRIRPANSGQGTVWSMVVEDDLDRHFQATAVSPGTWPAGPTGIDGTGTVRFTLRYQDGSTTVHTATGASTATWPVADPVGNPLVGLTVEYGDVPAGWTHNANANSISITGVALNPGRDGHTWDLVANRTATLPNTARNTGSVADALGVVAPVTRSATANVTVVAPQPAPSITKAVAVASGPTGTGGVYPGAVLRWTVTLTNPGTTATAAYPDPILLDVLPLLTGTPIGDPTNVVVTAPAGLSLVDPDDDDISDATRTTATGARILEWSFTGALGRDQTITVRFDTPILDATPPQAVTNRAWTTTNALDESVGEWFSTFTSGSGTWEADTGDLDDDGRTTDRVRRAQAASAILDEVVASSEKTVAGPAAAPTDPICDALDPGEQNEDYGDARCTRPGDRIDYRLTVTNDGNVALTDLVLIDLFPTPGDRLVLPNQTTGVVAGRGPGGVGSDFAPNLTGPVVSADPNVVVEYTTVTEPCRGGDFYPQLLPGSAAWPPGCSPANWTEQLPSPITAVRGIRITYAVDLSVGGAFSFEWPMRAPVTAQPGQIAYNAFAWAARSVGSTAQNQSAPPVVAVEVNGEPAPWLLGDRAWYDRDLNGTQDVHETGGVEGVPIAVFLDNDDSGTFTPNDLLVKHTITDVGGNAGAYLFNDLVDGRYFVIAAPPTSWVVSPAGTGAAADDSDAELLGRIDELGPGLDLDGWDPAALDPALHTHLWIAPVTIDGANDLTIDLGLWRPDPAIAVEKATNTVDADNAPGVHVPVGHTVVWTYEVTNTGNTELRDLALVDETTLGAAVDVDVQCVATVLAPGATTTCVGTTETPVTAVAGQYGNVVTATATPVLPPIAWDPTSYANLRRLDGSSFWVADDPEQGTVPVSSEDPSHYFGVDASIDLEKTVNGQDADVAPGVFVPVGDTVTWRYTLTNTGNVDLVVDRFVDDRLGVFGDDGDPDTTELTCASGSTLTFPVTLAPGASRFCLASGTASFGPYVNVATVAAQAVDDQGEPVLAFDEEGQPAGELPPVTDTDPAHHYGVAQPAVDLQKTTTGLGPDGPTGPTQADVGPGDTLRAGTVVTWTYTLTNTGNVDLHVPVLVDDVLGEVGDDGDPDTVDQACARVTAAFPLVLGVGETLTCELDGVAELGAYRNVASIRATPLDEAGAAITEQLTAASPVTPVPVAPLDDSDPSHYLGIGGPAIGLDKVTSGHSWDLDSATITTVGPGDGVQLTAGGPVVWTFTITNDGDTDLGGVTLVDDHGTPEDDSDDRRVTVVGDEPMVTGIPADRVVLGGDLDEDGILRVGDAWTITVTDVSALGSYENWAAVSAQPLDVGGDPLVNVGGDAVDRVDDTDDSSYVALAEPAIDLEKATDGEDADEPTGPYVLGAETITWTFDVTNSGGTALVEVVVTDPALAGAGVPAPVCTIELLLPGATERCTVTGPRFGSGQQRNEARVAGLPAAPVGEIDPADPSSWPTEPDAYRVFTIDGELVDPVADDDPSHHYGADPAITLDKRTNGEDAATPGSAVVLVPGDAVTWTFLVANTGNTRLTGIRLTDTVVSGDGTAGQLSCPSTSLEAGASMTCTMSGTAGRVDHANRATVTAQPVDGTGASVGPTVTATDVSHYRPARADLQVGKRPTAGVVDGEIVSRTIVWEISVHNAGPDPARDVEVVDELPDSLQFVSGGGGSWTCALQPAGEVRCALTAPLAVGETATVAITTLLVEDVDTVTNVAHGGSSSVPVDGGSGSGNTDSVTVDTSPGLSPLVPRPAPTDPATPSAPSGVLPSTGLDPIGFTIAVALLVLGVAMWWTGRAGPWQVVVPVERRTARRAR
jgi:uncharacterized repeat protein (TIGR01451 family)